MIMNKWQPEPTIFNSNFQPIIGVGVSLVNTLLDCVSQITIGNYVSFGHNCMVLTGYHDYTLKGESRMLSLAFAPVVIEDGVWVASGSIICPGVRIGKDSVIGAGSVVLHNVPPGELWAGQPAHFIKRIEFNEP